MNCIEFKNFTIKYENNVALNDITLNIKEGEFVCVVGKNGSGKSTFVKSLNALILPTSGDAYIYGMNTKDETKTLSIRKNIGITFQNPDNQIVASIVEEDVAFGLENIGVKTEEIRNRIDDAMKILDIYDLKDFLTSKLSGGQKQKVAIAGILAMKSKVIVLDEPTSMLDKISRIDLLETLKRLNKEENITIILISHYIEEINYADRVIVMYNGGIVMDCSPLEVINCGRELQKYGLELPYLNRLNYDLKLKGIHINLI